MIIAVRKYEEEVTVGNCIRKSFRYIMPLFLVNLLIGFLNLGAFFVFIIPVFFFSFFFMFVGYEVILADKKWLEAVRGSVRIVGQHFGEILVRWILYILIYIVLFVFIPNVIRKIEPQTYIFLMIIYMFTNTLFSWFGIAFSVILYKQAKEATDENKPVSLAWVWIISILGWIILGLAILGSAVLISKARESGALRQIQENIFKEMSGQTNKDRLIEEKMEKNIPAASRAPTIIPAAPTCMQYIIREGEFASDKCYSQKDYGDLMYYLQRFNSSASTYNGAVASMGITCTGSDFFKDSCERNKKQKEQSESDMNNYRGIIQGIIARGE
jgi:hypothetical protein